MANEIQNIRQMNDDDLEQVLDIIHEHDEDDAEEAARDYKEFGLTGQFIISDGRQIIGVTGVRLIEATDQSYKLSWTYIKKSYCGQGFGRQLLTFLFNKVQFENGRKIFVYVSDYVNESGVGIYDVALKLYLSMGFVEEAKIQNYYDNGASLTVLGLELQQIDADFNSTASESPIIAFKELFPVAETESTFSVSWEVKSFGKPFEAADLKQIIEGAYDAKAKQVLLSFPSNFDNISMPLFEAGFGKSGQLKDYFEDGVHEDHYIFRV